MSDANQPPPWPPAPYGPPPGGGTPYNAAEAISYGLKKFVENIGSMLLISLCVILVPMVMDQINNLITGTSSLLFPTPGNCDPASPDYVSCVLRQTPSAGPGVLISFLSFGISLISILISILLQAALYKGALLIVDGQQPGLGDMFRGWSKPRQLGTVLLVGLITFVGVLLCVLPGIIAAFLLIFAPLLAVDTVADSVTVPLRGSFELVKNNVGQLILLVILQFLVVVLGLLACCIGIVAAIPMVSIAMAYSLRILQGRPVAG